jgi:hypothetical protein
MADEQGSTDPTTTKRWEFNPEQLDRTVLAIPLLNDINTEKEPKVHAVVMEINLEHPKPRDETLKLAEDIVNDAIGDDRGQALKPTSSRQYLYARLLGDTIRDIVDRNEAADRPIYRIWPDFEIGPL